MQKVGAGGTAHLLRYSAATQLRALNGHRLVACLAIFRIGRVGNHLVAGFVADDKHQTAPLSIFWAIWVATSRPSLSAKANKNRHRPPLDVSH